MFLLQGEAIRGATATHCKAARPDVLLWFYDAVQAEGLQQPQRIGTRNTFSVIRVSQSKLVLLSRPYAGAWNTLECDALKPLGMNALPHPQEDGHGILYRDYIIGLIKVSV